MSLTSSGSNLEFELGIPKLHFYEKNTFSTAVLANCSTLRESSSMTFRSIAGIDSHIDLRLKEFKLPLTESQIVFYVTRILWLWCKLLVIGHIFYYCSRYCT
jgi:hypothetical protein